MEKLGNYIAEKYKNNKKQLFIVLLSTFAWGLIAHGYMFLNNSVTRDSMIELFADIEWKVSIGRFMSPLLQFLTRGLITLPWITGLLGLLYISISVFLIIKIFSVSSGISIVLISGICTVNTMTIATISSCLHDFDVYMFGLLLSVLAVYLWRFAKHGSVWGCIALAFSLGCYQSMLCVSITLILMCLIFDLTVQPFKSVFNRGIRAVFMLLSAGILYYLLLQISLVIIDIELASEGNPNSPARIFSIPLSELGAHIVATYIFTVKKLLVPIQYYSTAITAVIHAPLALTVLLFGLRNLFNRQIKIVEKLAFTVLCALLPLGMNITRVLSQGKSHDIMLYALSLFYVFAISILDRKIHRSHNGTYNASKLCMYQKSVSSILILVVLLCNIRIANKAYLMKNFQYDATLSFFTRVVTDIEEYDGYISGETEVIFWGIPEAFNEALYSYGEIDSLVGMHEGWSMCAGLPQYYKAYFEKIQITDIKIADNSFLNDLSESEELKDMSVYPRHGSIKMIDGVVVVKLSENSP